jgi:hypothetical protein
VTGRGEAANVRDRQLGWTHRRTLGRGGATRSSEARRIKALDLTIPPSLLLHASQVIE